MVIVWVVRLVNGCRKIRGILMRVILVGVAVILRVGVTAITERGRSLFRVVWG